MRGVRLWHWVLLCSLWLWPCGVQGQQLYGLVYYDLGGLYDTSPSPFGGDEHYTPKGRMVWTEERYEAALERYAALIDTLGMPLVALFGVENEGVALDLAARSRGDYAVVHRTSNRRDGLDFALLYQADYLLPKRVESDYGLLLIEGDLDGRRVDLLLTNDQQAIEEVLERRHLERKSHSLIVVGNTGRIAPRYGLRDAMHQPLRAGRGTRLSRGLWWMRDRAWLGADWELLRGDVFATKWLFDDYLTAPLPLYEGERYRGGWSKNLPIFLYFRAANLEN